MPAKLTNLTICGFKTIRELRDFRPGPLTVLIGANGAGKSNFLSFFRLLGSIFTTPSALRTHVALWGGAHTMLHKGPETTREILAGLTVQTTQEEHEYKVRLSYAAGDTLIFADQQVRWHPITWSPNEWIELGGGDGDAKLPEQGDARRPAVVDNLRLLLRKCIVHQFHNTSQTGRIRQKWPINDNHGLKEDAGNLAPVLFRLREHSPEYYRRIIETLRLILPFFEDFELRDDHDAMLLQWRERRTDLIFDVSQASDGMLRAMALVTLLQQPEEDLPAVLILDEPELGLHPYATNIITGLIRAASLHTQVILATQSTAFVDCFEPDEIVVVNRAGMESTFDRLSAEELKEWLEEYSLSELWEKNVVGGRPRR